MSTSIEWQAVTKTAEETEALAEKIGRRLQGGEVIELISDLGGGKTTFVRGLVRGLGSSAKVSSPTFTISKLYKAPKHEVFHFDFYRLPEAGLMAAELAEVTEDPSAIVAVEWADVVQHVLPASRLTVRIEQTPEGQRRLHFSCPESLEYALEGLRQ
jgi:tRNA threonylcarbamoyladenosine biosynthesis protein TsaE